MMFSKGKAKVVVKVTGALRAKVKVAFPEKEKERAKARVKVRAEIAATAKEAVPGNTRCYRWLLTNSVIVDAQLNSVA